MSEKRTNKQYPAEFKEEAVALIQNQGYSASGAAKSLGIGTSCCKNGRNNSKLSVKVAP